MVNDAERTTFKYLRSSVCVDCLACMQWGRIQRTCPEPSNNNFCESVSNPWLVLAHIAASHTACVTQVGPLRYMIPVILSYW